MEQNPQKAIDKYDGKTIRITHDNRSRIFAISVEYIPEANELEVTLRSISTSKEVRSSNLESDLELLPDIYKIAYQKAIEIADKIQEDLDVDFEEDL